MNKKINWGVVAISAIITFFVLHFGIDVFVNNNKANKEYYDDKSKYDYFIGSQFIINDEVRTIIEYIPCSETFVLDNGSRISANPEYITLHYNYNGLDSTKMIKQ